MVSTNAPAAAASGTTPSAVGNTYKHILRATALIGSSAVIGVAIGMVRTKALAVMLGPAGLGLMAALTTITDIARNVAEAGVGSSGVRKIAQSAATNDETLVARTATVLRWTFAVLGVLGAGALALASAPVAELTFGHAAYAPAVALVSLAVLFRLVSHGQGALLQGLRLIGDQVRINVAGAAIGAAASIAVVYWLGESGVALSLVVASAATLAVSWWYSRKARAVRHPGRIGASVLGSEALDLLRLGMAFMMSGCLTAGAAYLVRVILIRHEGLEAAGLYHAAWTVGGLYVTMVLQAMGTDFYPRLVAAANDNSLCNQLVNEQARVSLLLAGCGVVGTLAFAPWVVSILYSSEFQGATQALHWICLGMAMRVITWPVGYILMAKGRGKLFVSVDFAWSVVNVLLTWLCVEWLGFKGAGVAFFASYVLHLFIVYPVARRISGFRWAPATLRTGAMFVVVVAIVEIALITLPQPVGLSVGIMTMLLMGVYAFSTLRALVRGERPGLDAPAPPQRSER